MTDIIERIYNDISMNGYIVSRELRQLYGKMDALWSSVEPVLEPETIEKLQEYQVKIEGQVAQEWFREGLRAGLSLVIEAL